MRLRPNPRNPVHLLACGLGSGLSPRAPGTAGSLVGVALFVALASLPLAAYVACWIGLAVAGVWLSGRTAADLGVEDHPGIVIDEITGFLVTMTAAPQGWPWIVAGFVLFRIFDVAKPWPVDALERRFGGGLGIMLDDIAAGALACVALQLLARLVA